jgi:hypothetical protein
VLVAQAVQLGSHQHQFETGQEAEPAPLRSPKSHIGVIAADSGLLDAGPNACDGLSVGSGPGATAFQDDADDDADSYVSQSRHSASFLSIDVANPSPVTVVAEWNGKGNLLAFAYRARASWRHSVGLPPEPKPVPPPRKIPRRIRRPRPSPVRPIHVISANDLRGGKGADDYTETAKVRHQEQLVQDCMATALILCYLWFHFREDCRDIFWFLLVPSGHAEMVQYLREWR